MDYRVMGSQTRLHAAKAVPSWPLDQSSPLSGTLPLIFAAYEKRLLAAWPKEKGASLLQEAKLLPPTERL